MSVGDAVVAILQNEAGRRAELWLAQVAAQMGATELQLGDFEWTDDSNPEVRKWIVEGWEAEEEPDGPTIAFRRRDWDLNTFAVPND